MGWNLYEYLNFSIQNPNLEETLTEHQLRTAELAGRAQSNAAKALTVIAAKIKQTKINLDEYITLEVSCMTTGLERPKPPVLPTNNALVVNSIPTYFRK